MPINRTENYKFTFHILLILLFALQSSLACSTSDQKNALETEQKITQANYRGNSQHTGTFDDQEDGFTSSQEWKYFNTKKGIVSAPSVINGTAFFGSFDRFFYALDAGNGEPKWRFETLGSIITSSSVSDGAVYFGSMDGNFYALDSETGNKRWSFKTASSNENAQGPLAGEEEAEIVPSGDISETQLKQVVYRIIETEPEIPESKMIPDKGISSSPVISDGMVYFGTFGKRFYALNIATGSEAWEFKTSYEINYCAAVSNGVVYFSTGHHLFALDAKTGEKKWENKIQNGVGGATPITSQGLVLYDDGVNLMAFDSATGKEVWNIEVGAEMGPDGGPSVKDGFVFLGSDKGFRAIELATGREIWVNNTIQPASSGIPPSIAGNLVYFIDLQGTIDALDVSSGELKGQYSFQTGFKPSWQTATTMAISNGVIYVGSMDGNLYAIPLSLVQSTSLSTEEAWAELAVPNNVQATEEVHLQDPL